MGCGYFQEYATDGKAPVGIPGGVFQRSQPPELWRSGKQYQRAGDRRAYFNGNRSQRHSVRDAIGILKGKRLKIFYGEEHISSGRRENAMRMSRAGSAASTSRLPRRSWASRCRLIGCLRTMGCVEKAQRNLPCM